MAAIKVFLVAIGLGSAARLHNRRVEPRVENEALLEVGATVGIKPQPLVVNHAEVPLAVYLEREILFNKQVIHPGEAVQLWNPQKGPNVLPYKIIVVVGDENSLPSDFDSLLHFAGKAAVPTAFVGGVVVSVITWGALSGPAAALAPMVSSLPAVAGFTVGAVDVAAGTTAAVAATATKQKIAEEAAINVLKEHPAAFMTKTKWIYPGTRYFEVTGGPTAGAPDPLPLVINEIDNAQYISFNITTVKACQALQTRGTVGKPAFTLQGAGEASLNGKWWPIGFYNDRPQYVRAGHELDRVLQWSKKCGCWRITTSSGVWGRKTFYESTADAYSVPDLDWVVVDGVAPAPTLKLNAAFNVSSCGNAELVGQWAIAGQHNNRPKYVLIGSDDDNAYVIEYSNSHRFWRVTKEGSGFFGSNWKTPTYYKSRARSWTIPVRGWVAVDGVAPAPQVELALVRPTP